MTRDPLLGILPHHEDILQEKETHFHLSHVASGSAHFLDRNNLSRYTLIAPVDVSLGYGEVLTHLEPTSSLSEADKSLS